MKTVSTCDFPRLKYLNGYMPAHSVTTTVPGQTYVRTNNSTYIIQEPAAGQQVVTTSYCPPPRISVPGGYIPIEQNETGGYDKEHYTSASYSSSSSSSYTSTYNGTNPPATFTTSAWITKEVTTATIYKTRVSTSGSAYLTFGSPYLVRVSAAGTYTRRTTMITDYSKTGSTGTKHDPYTIYSGSNTLFSSSSNGKSSSSYKYTGMTSIYGKTSQYPYSWSVSTITTGTTYYTRVSTSATQYETIASTTAVAGTSSSSISAQITTSSWITNTNPVSYTTTSLNTVTYTTRYFTSDTPPEAFTSQTTGRTVYSSVVSTFTRSTRAKTSSTVLVTAYGSSVSGTEYGNVSVSGFMTMATEYSTVTSATFRDSDGHVYAPNNATLVTGNCYRTFLTVSSNGNVAQDYRVDINESGLYATALSSTSTLTGGNLRPISSTQTTKTGTTSYTYSTRSYQTSSVIYTAGIQSMSSSGTAGTWVTQG